MSCFPGEVYPVSAAFDVLHLNGEDLRTLPLRERKNALRKIAPWIPILCCPLTTSKRHGEASLQPNCGSFSSTCNKQHRCTLCNLAGNMFRWLVGFSRFNHC